MDSSIGEFEVADRWGATHRYVVGPHGAKAGLEISRRLGMGAIGALLPAVKALISGDVVKPVEGDEPATEPSGDILDRLLDAADPVGIRNAIAELDPDLVMKILSETTRDGAKLSDRGAFDEAYARNYSECMLAVWHVVQHNGFLPGLDTFATSKPGKLTAAKKAGPAGG